MTEQLHDVGPVPYVSVFPTPEDLAKQREEAAKATAERAATLARAEQAVAAAVTADPLLQEFVETFALGGGRPSRGCPMHEIGPLAVTLFGPLSARPTTTMESPHLAPRLLVNMALGDLARDQDCTTRICTGTHDDPAVEGIRVWDQPGAAVNDREIIVAASRLLHDGEVQDGLTILARSYPALRFALTFRFGVDPRRLFEPVFADGEGAGGEGEGEEALALDLARRFWLPSGVASGLSQ